MAAQVAALPPLPAAHTRHQHQNCQTPQEPAPPLPPPPPPPLPPLQVYHNLPADLAAQVAALNNQSNHTPPPPPPAQIYHHLPYGLAAQVGNVPPMPPIHLYQRHQALYNPAPFPLPPPPPSIELDALPPVDLDPPLPPPNNLQDLPEAHQPFDQSWEIHHLGPMNIKCRSCNAWHFKSERLTNSTNTTPIFGMCCTSGKIKLPRLEDPPRELRELLEGQDQRAKSFRDHIWKYNNALAMTSLSCTLDDSINHSGAGPYVFKAHGQLIHRAGSLYPNEGQTPLYAQLYIYDGQEALNYHMDHAANHDLDRGTMQILQDMLFRHHPGVAMYKQALELTSHMPPEHQCKIALRFDERTDRRCYNLPTAAAANEIAVIIPGDGDQPQDCHDIVLYHWHGQPLQHISEMHPMYLPLHYVLLFPTGQLGWHKRMLHTDAPDAPAPAADEENPLNNNAEVSWKQRYVTQIEWFCYCLFPCADQSLHLFMSGKLL